MLQSLSLFNQGGVLNIKLWWWRHFGSEVARSVWCKNTCLLSGHPADGGQCSGPSGDRPADAQLESHHKSTSMPSLPLIQCQPAPQLHNALSPPGAAVHPVACYEWVELWLCSRRPFHLSCVPVQSNLKLNLPLSCVWF